MDYFSAEQLEPEAIEAALEHGTLEVWRKDPVGVQWYRRPTTTFHATTGVPDDIDEGGDIEAEASADDFTDDVAPNVWRKTT